MKTSATLWLFTICLCLITANIHSQNLVINPSFEITTSNCSNIGGETIRTDLAGSWDNAHNDAASDSCTSPDLFSACNNTLNPSAPTLMPNSPLGYQYSRTGTRHAGIITYEFFSEYREYVQGTLTSPLVAGQRYIVSMYVSLANEMPYATNNMGVYFSNTHYLRNACPGETNSRIYVTPQLNSAVGAITDTTSNWYKLQWTYIAQGGESYFVIGNFFDNANTLKLTTGKPLVPYTYAYYYIDDVSVSPYSCADSIAFSNVVYPGCGTNSGSLTADVQLAGNPSSYTYLWNTTDTGRVLTQLASGVYTVTATDGFLCSVTASIYLNPAGTDTVTVTTTNVTCSMDNGTATLHITGNTGFDVLWSTGDTTLTIDSLAEGTYDVTVNFINGCQSYYNAQVHRNYIPVTTGSLSICYSDSVELCAVPNYFSYLWNNGSTSPCINATLAGQYQVTVMDNTGCAEISEPVHVTIYATQTNTITYNGSILTAAANNVQYQWLLNGSAINGANFKNYQPSQTGNYAVRITTVNGCILTSSPIFVPLCSAHFVLIPADTTTHTWLALSTITGLNPATATWQWGDGSASSTGLVQTHTYDSAAYYTICLTIADGGGCVATYCDSSTYIFKDNDQTMITVNCVTEMPTGITQVPVSIAVKIYPNPANDVLFIDAGETEVNSANIYDVTGKLIKSVSLSDAKNGIDIGGLSTGIYIAEIRTQHGSVRKRWAKL